MHVCYSIYIYIFIKIILSIFTFVHLVRNFDLTLTPLEENLIRSPQNKKPDTKQCLGTSLKTRGATLIGINPLIDTQGCKIRLSFSNVMDHQASTHPGSLKDLTPILLSVALTIELCLL